MKSVIKSLALFGFFGAALALGCAAEKGGASASGGGGGGGSFTSASRPVIAASTGTSRPARVASNGGGGNRANFFSASRANGGGRGVASAAPSNFNDAMWGSVNGGNAVKSDYSTAITQ